MTRPNATTARIHAVRLPGGPAGREACDCRRQRHARLPAELGGQWACLGCGSRFTPAPPAPSLRQRIGSWCSQHQADILTGAVPAAVVIGSWLGGLWP